MNNYFGFSRNNINGLVDMVKQLYDFVEKYDNPNFPLLRGDIKKYSDYIDSFSIPEKPQKVHEVLSNFSCFFQRCVKWEHYGAMINITPPANIPSIATSSFCHFFNPNLAVDESSGYLAAIELSVIKMLCELVGWEYKNSTGLFTFGGKATNMYAVKTGLNKTFPQNNMYGVDSSKLAILSSEKAHPCHKEVCEWLGIGRSSHYSIPVSTNGQIDLLELDKLSKDLIISGKRISCILLNGGTTNEVIVDPILEVVKWRDQLVNELNLDYVPHVHVDSVIGWAWMFFKNYDYKINSLNMLSNEKTKILSLQQKISEVKYADSFGVDFHKTGFCPYISSVIMIKKRKDICRAEKYSNMEDVLFGEYAPFEFSLELSRSSLGPVAAWTSLQCFGYEGYQELLYRVFSNGEFIRSIIGSYSCFRVLNCDSEGFATLFIALPEGMCVNFDNTETSARTIELIREYNNKFFLFLTEALEQKKINFKLTFSKSYRINNSCEPLGALKIYQTSPIASRDDIAKCIYQLHEMKHQFDISNACITDRIKRPKDLVYRD